LVLLGLWCAWSFLSDAWILASFPLIWTRHAEAFYISAEHDDFDRTFANYSIHQTSAAPLPDRVPPILHHISLGAGAATHSKWAEVRQSCVDIHPGWEAHLWTDDTADAFVAKHFPELREMWLSYRYPIQRIDALRYMALYHYGGMYGTCTVPSTTPYLPPHPPLPSPNNPHHTGVILDMDLQCKRALGPFRRFAFVAPAAHPTGFSVGFLMASKRNAYVGQLVANLPRYNKHWLGLPYPTVMFSTGCHYASWVFLSFSFCPSTAPSIAGRGWE
jgi:mannosyltransferase OCH1-like enzyme